LFLDELGDMPIAMQAKLCAFWKKAKSKRVGGDKTVKVSVRVVVATHRNLEELVAQYAFRRDYFTAFMSFLLCFQRFASDPRISANS